MINKNSISTYFEQLDPRIFDYIGCVYFNIFKNFPKIYRIYFGKEKNELTYSSIYDSSFAFHKSINNSINTMHFLSSLDENRSSDIDIISLTTNEHLCIIDKNVNNTSDSKNINCLIPIITGRGDDSDMFFTVYTNDIDNVIQIIEPWITRVDDLNNAQFGITSVDCTGSLYTSLYDYNNFDIDIKTNYNDDLPYDRICEIIENESKPELMLFYGEPGTGKTSFIKHLIYKYMDKKFVFMDGTLMANVQQDHLISYFLENQNTIFILEDCEKILMNREHNINRVMPVLLNLTDGIIGDILGIKLICTFNTSLNNIDKALIRKGRLSLKYEFKKLAVNKVQNLLNDNNINTEMTLADIYCQAENDFSKNNTKKIGF